MDSARSSAVVPSDGHGTGTPDTPDTPGNSPATAATVARLRVEGMHCASCVALIHETLTEVPGVASASVDLDGARAVVAFDPAVVGPDELCAAIGELGYPATPAG